jgi:hypothetical protein
MGPPKFFWAKPKFDCPQLEFVVFRNFCSESDRIFKSKIVFLCKFLGVPAVSRLEAAEHQSSWTRRGTHCTFHQRAVGVHSCLLPISRILIDFLNDSPIVTCWWLLWWL